MLYFRAQDKGMMNGEYAWFAFFSTITKNVSQPWLSLDIADDELDHRKKVYYAIKQVRYWLKEPKNNLKNSFRRQRLNVLNIK